MRCLAGAEDDRVSVKALMGRDCQSHTSKSRCVVFGILEEACQSLYYARLMSNESRKMTQLSQGT